jgi:hypothetical protein
MDARTKTESAGVFAESRMSPPSKTSKSSIFEMGGMPDSEIQSLKWNASPETATSPIW